MNFLSTFSDKSPAIPQQLYKTAPRSLSAIAELLVSYPFALDAPVRGVSVGIAAPLLVQKKTRMVSLPDGEKFRRYVYSF